MPWTSTATRSPLPHSWTWSFMAELYLSAGGVVGGAVRRTLEVGGLDVGVGPGAQQQLLPLARRHRNEEAAHDEAHGQVVPRPAAGIRRADRRARPGDAVPDRLGIGPRLHDEDEGRGGGGRGARSGA